MIDNRTLHKEFGLLERQVSQVCQIVDQKVFKLTEELVILKNMIEIVGEKVAKIEKQLKDEKDGHR